MILAPTAGRRRSASRSYASRTRLRRHRAASSFAAYSAASLAASSGSIGAAAGIPASPAQKLSLPKLPDNNFVPLTVAQVQTLAKAAPPHASALVLVQAGLGPRLGELLALRAKEVSLTFRVVRIQEQLTQNGKQRTDTKNGVHRTVPISDLVVEVLRAHMADFPPTTEDELIFTVNGIAWRQDQYDRVFRRAVQDGGLPTGTTSHTLRHHFVSVLLHAGISVVEVAELIGDTAEMVTKVYGHVMPNSEDRPRRPIDLAWSTDGQATVSDLG